MKRLIPSVAFGVLLMLLPGLSWAQQGTITGTVTEAETGDPLPGATVQIPDEGTGAAANSEGQYRIAGVPAGERTVRVTFVGYQAQERTVNVPDGGTVRVNFQLRTSQAELEEVVVTGYAERDRREVTGSVQSISGEELEGTPDVQTEELLQGQAGVQVTSTSGVPGGQVSVNVRGPSSIQGDSQPLYVIDGVPVESGDLGDGLGTQLSPLSSLNPRDIESIEVLKDASAGAIYGSRASNGVILIQTKGGDSGRTQVSFSSQVGVQEATREFDLLNGPEWAEIHRESIENLGLPPGTPGVFGQPIPEPENAPDADWIGTAFERGTQQEQSLSVQGGNESTTFRLSGTYFTNDSFQFSSFYERISGRLKLDHEARDWLQFGGNLNLTQETNEQAGNDNLFLSPFTSSALMPPINPIRNEDGQFNFDNPWNNTPNVIATAQLNDEDLGTYRIQGNTFVEAEPISGLTLRVQGGGDVIHSDYFQARTRLDGDGAPNGQAGRTTRENERFNIDPTIEWSDEVGSHSYSALVGYSYEYRQRSNVFVFGNNTPTDDFKNTASVAEPTVTSSTVDRKTRLQATFLQSSYSFQNRYFLDFNARLDGSSRLAEGNRWGFFPGGSVGWEVSNESFMDGVDDVGQLRLRFSVGRTGDASALGTFDALDLYGGGANYNNSPGIFPSQLGNPDLEWEKATEFNIGLDLALYNDRLELTTDLYTRTTDNLILPVPTPQTSGFANVPQNVGEMRNRGVDLSLTTRNLVEGDFTGDFRWRTNFSASYLENEVRDLGSLDDPIIGGGFAEQRAVEGEPVGTFFLIPWEGVDPQTGKPVWRGADGNLTNSPTADARQLMGNPLPEWTITLGNTFEYGNFQLRANLYAELGRDIYNATREFLAAPVGFNMVSRSLERWQEPGDQTTVPRMLIGDQDNAAQESSRFLENGAFLRLRNVTLSYTLPSALTNATPLTGGRIYVRGQNIATIDQVTQGDPEVSFAGQVNGLNRGNSFFTAPQTRSITVGLDVDL